MIIVQSWRGIVPAGFEWTMTLSAGLGMDSGKASANSDGKEDL